MAEGSSAEKFPDEWDALYLRGVIVDSLAASISIDFLIRRKVSYLFFTQREVLIICLLYTSPSPRDATLSRMPSAA